VRGAGPVGMPGFGGGTAGLHPVLRISTRVSTLAPIWKEELLRSVEAMSILQILLIIAVAALVIGKRMTGRPVDARRSVVMPGVLAVYGLAVLHKSGIPLSHTDQVWLVLQGAVSVVIGVVRGCTIRLYERDGVVWARYRPVTLLLWIGSIAARFALEAAAVASGADKSAMTSSIMLMFGLSLAAESLIVLPRAHASGIPVMVRS
jgi:hypothetical protein